MKPKLLKATHGQFEQAEFKGDTSGLLPIGDQLVVLPDKAAQKTAGGVLLPEQQQERDSAAAETGLVIAVGEGAFMWSADRARPFAGRKPQVGERITFVRYAGAEHIGVDGERYRVMTDSCVGCIVGAKEGK